MIPRDKAQELVNRFLPHVDCDVRFEDSELKNAKKCALIAMDEILNVLFQHYKIDYWQEVKYEIEQL